MNDLRSLRTKVDCKKRPFWRPMNHPVPESPPEPLQCEHCLGKNSKLTHTWDYRIWFPGEAEPPGPQTRTLSRPWGLLA